MTNLNWDNIKKIYFTGIGGIGVSALARYYHLLNYEVLGSDLVENEIVKDLKNLGIKINLNQKAENIENNIDLLVYSSAVPEKNPERQRAKELNIKQLSYNELLGYLSKEKNTIAISGTNGKTTTTAMTGLILEKASLDPLVLVGSKVMEWNSNLRFSQSDLFVLEACEYKAHMLELSPKTIVLTNIAEDHLDYYKDLDDIIKHFQIYIDKLQSSDDLLIYNADDENIAKLNWQDRNYRVLTFGIENLDADITIDKYTVDKGTQDFWVKYNNKKLFRAKLHVPGIYNVYNALASIAVAISKGIEPDIIKEALANFKGTWRRFEIFLEKDDIIYVSDYAHHPDAIKLTIQASKEFYPDRRLIIVFQAHQHNRTKKLFNEFVDSFVGADLVLLPDIYDVKGRENLEDQDIHIKDLFNAIKKKYPDLEIQYTADLQNTLNIIKDIRKAGDLIILMGAGDIDDLRYSLN